MATQPTIIRKKKRAAAHGHHGGAWKLAYADFVTAMMAFFLLMWLLGFSKEETKKGIAEYFENPYKASLLGGDSVGERTQVIKGGGSDMTSKDMGQTKSQVVKTTETSPNDQAKIEQEQKIAAVDAQNLEALKEKIKSLIEAKPELHEFKDQIKLEITDEGLRILIIDNNNKPMFNRASAQAAPQTRTILRELAPVINEMPNKIGINGHTDALPYPGNQTGYTNWELSSDRANAARQELVKGGVDEEKIMRVIGLASSSPYNVRDRLDPMNRRISIIVMSHKTEEHILEESSPQAAEASQTPEAHQAADIVKSLEAAEAASKNQAPSPVEMPH